jgi:predicted SAM-dependent methyltransferase
MFIYPSKNHFNLNKKMEAKSKYNKFKYLIIKILYPFYKFYCDWKWQKKWQNYLKNHSEINLNIGSANNLYPNWFPTDIQFISPQEIQINVFQFDATNEKDYQKSLKNRKIKRILAEHVFEHLTLSQIEAVLKNFYQYSEPEMNIRIAVPDGFHSDPNYIELVKPGGTGEGAHDHKNLFTYRSLSELFEKQGFKANFVEYWDEKGIFHPGYQDDDKGIIRRSLVNDFRNQDGKPHYTSLIIDFSKL